MTAAQIKRAIITGGFTNDELRGIFDAAKIAWRNNSVVAAQTFCEGDNVKFTGRHNITHTGKVLKVNIKTVTVMVDRTKWKVAASLLQAA